MKPEAKRRRCSPIYPRILTTLLITALISISLSAHAQTESILNAITPAHPANPSDKAPVELGVQFRSSVAGQVEAIRFYRAVDSPSGFRAVFWNASSKKVLASAKNASGSVPAGGGWVQINLSTPIPISSNTSYMVSYYASNGQYAYEQGAEPYALANNIIYQHLTLLKGSGALHYYNSSYNSSKPPVFPTTLGNSINYFVDLVFRPANQPPIVALTSPTANQSFTAPASITLQANASDSDGSVAKVEFFQGTTKLGEVATSPYSFNWNNAPIGNYSLKAIATDNLGLATTSSPVTIAVKDLTAPTVPTNLATSSISASSVSLNWSPSVDELGGSGLAGYNVYRGGVLIGTSTSSSYADATVSPSSVYTYQVAAYDAASNRSNLSSTLSVTTPALSNIAPIVTLTSPTANQTFTAPANITIQANASDSDGSVAKVEFFQGATKLGEVTTAPYTFSWNNVPIGTYSLQAVVTDNLGLSATSPSVSVFVNDLTPPTVPTNLTTPSIAANSVSLSWSPSADELGGSGLAGYNIYRGGILIGTSTSSSYVDATVSPSLEYAYQAAAYDSASNLSNLSSALLVTTPALSNIAPIVTLTSPTANQSFTAPANIMVQANASDSDGSVAKVEFFQGTTKLGEATTAPYMVAWNNVPSGNYSLKAVATDNLGLATTSSSVSIVVNDLTPPALIGDTLIDFESGNEGDTVTSSIVTSGTKGKLFNGFATLSNPSAQTQGVTPFLKITSQASFRLPSPVSINGSVYSDVGNRGMRAIMDGNNCIRLKIPTPGYMLSVGFYFRFNGPQINWAPRDVVGLRSDPTGNYQFLQIYDGPQPYFHTHWQPYTSPADGGGNNVNFSRDKWYWVTMKHVGGGQNTEIRFYDPAVLDANGLYTLAGASTGPVSSGTQGCTTIQIGVINYSSNTATLKQSVDFDNFVINTNGTFPLIPGAAGSSAAPATQVLAETPGITAAETLMTTGVNTSDSGIVTTQGPLQMNASGPNANDIGWAAGDIGTVAIPGASYDDGGMYTVSGSGLDIQGNADAFQFVSQTLVGDGEIRARVTSQTDTNEWAKAGVMIRDGSSAGDINAFVAITPRNGFSFQWRDTAAGATVNTAGPALNTVPNNWVRLTRSGTILSAYASADGAFWMQIGTVNLTMNRSVSIGLAVTSHNNTALSTATFDNVTITPFPSPWLTTDIGSTGMQGSAEYYGNIYSLMGAGTLGGTADGFRYVYQSLNGDGSIIARISTLQNTGIGEAVGVMVRDTLMDTSKMAALSVDANGTWNSQIRTSTGGSVSTTTSGRWTAPNLWLKLERSGDTITPSRSTDGVNWTPIGSSTVTMASDCYIGLSVASGSSTTLNTSVMDNVNVVP